ncbi:hypothetical protein EMIHUDRAFT_227468 [Emiliania huxleyi CCMP1516]|uniref:Uncharacterized protein n=2 Tax=Emiliania huxleyi TaxID=2903 RepID=A0A0D3KIU1_EMIH1|nr:hypothetical protein EMIHUDRAFT_227468 [Emiliania huxleyi CCMP1516]EOD35676.1 hypothetical protein EMIHUDRAFT_227468 [Emiliania huxleyi CCMP1516]|eukprot:XP_005788105.1 hypothetical protein EMIHUDRAFT_227468 [Emiliania huxleyi CCMP1516]
MVSAPEHRSAASADGVERWSGFGSARALRLTMQAAQPPEERQPGDFAERAMKDINRVGPSDARKKAIEDKMRQLREQGKVASNSIMTDSMAELGAAKEGESGYKPKVGTWGVFERPADISKAYGGGKRVGLGGYQEDEETRAKKRAETEELLRQYRRSRGMDLTLELEHADEIAAAQEEARQLMRFGDRRGAISQLEAVTEWCTSNTPLGGSTLLELAIALDADGRRDEARKLFVKLQSSEDKNTRKVDASGAGSEAEYAKLATPTLMAARQFRTYSTTDGVPRLCAETRPPVESISEARMVLRTAAVRRDAGGAPQRAGQSREIARGYPRLAEIVGTPERVGQSLEFLRTLRREECVRGRAAEALPSLRGEWLLGLTVGGDGKPSFAPLQAQMTLAADERFERRLPALLGALATTVGGYEVRDSSDGAKLIVEWRGSECRAGPLPLPAESGTDGVLYLDSLMLVLQRPERAQVWVRPTMRDAADATASP